MKILIVEDSSRLAKLFKQGLIEEGYYTAIAKDGKIGLEMASSGEFDLILLDINMPKMNGYELITELRKERSDIPVIIITARESVEDRINGLDCGADDYMVKPIAFEELLARIRVVGRRLQAQGKNELVYMDIRLNISEGRAWRANQRLSLSPREFNLLRVFMQHPEQILSREKLEKLAWDSEYDGLSNRLDVYVNYLRTKLEKQSRKRVIQTIRYRGYYFGDETIECQ